MSTALFLNTTGRGRVFPKYLQIRLLLGPDIAGVVISYDNVINWNDVVDNLNETCAAYGYDSVFNFILSMGVNSDFYGSRCMPIDLINIDPDTYPFAQVMEDMTQGDRDRTMNIVKGLFKTYTKPYKRGDCRYVRRISQRINERFPELLDVDGELPLSSTDGRHPLCIDYNPEACR